MVRNKEARLRAGGAYEDNNLVFSGAEGQLFSPRDVSKAFISMAKRAGLEKVGIHTLRHTLITERLRAGINPKVVSERAGHSSVAFTLERYGHVLPDMQQAAADETEKLVGGLVRK